MSLLRDFLAYWVEIMTEPLTAPMTGDLDVAVLLPCYNEATTIADVVRGFQVALPQARIYVYDNNSTDGTALAAMMAGAIVRSEKRQGKGNVVRRMFADVDADIYVMADGDGTYAPADANTLIAAMLADGADMAVGTRRGVHDDAGRQGHAFGNRIFNSLYRRLFGNDFSDIFSGYRAYTRRFVKSFPALSSGFETETEMSVHASRLKLPVVEIELDYGRRPEGSHSKLSTFGDGWKILKMFAMLMKETRPFAFFGALSWAAFCTAIGFALPVLLEFFETGQVSRMPSWVLSVAMIGLSFLSFTAGMILDSLSHARYEHLRLAYIAQSEASRVREASRASHARQPVRDAA